MAFIHTGIAAYMPQNPKAFVGQTIFKDKFLELIKQNGIVMTGVKTSDKIVTYTGDVAFQTGNNCTWAASGDFTLTDKNVTVGSIKIQEEICPQDLVAKYFQTMMKEGSDNFDENIFFDIFMNEKQARIARAIAVAIWQGDTASGVANLNKFDGLNKLIDAATDEINGNPTAIATATGIVAANVIGIFDGVYNLIPAALLNESDLIITCGFDTFRTYCAALKTANMFNYIPNGVEEIMLPGTNVRIVPTHGLNGTNRIHAMRLSNIVIATDMENEFEEAMIKFDESTLKNRFSCYFKLGVQVAVTSEVVTFKLV